MGNLYGRLACVQNLLRLERIVIYKDFTERKKTRPV
jgi:hypothetical protein